MQIAICLTFFFVVCRLPHRIVSPTTTEILLFVWPNKFLRALNECSVCILIVDCLCGQCVSPTTHKTQQTKHTDECKIINGLTTQLSFHIVAEQNNEFIKNDESDTTIAIASRIRTLNVVHCMDRTNCNVWSACIYNKKIIATSSLYAAIVPSMNTYRPKIEGMTKQSARFCRTSHREDEVDNDDRKIVCGLHYKLRTKVNYLFIINF